MSARILKGDEVRIRPEWRDKGDENFTRLDGNLAAALTNKPETARLFWRRATLDTWRSLNH